MQKSEILIVDDSEINRTMLRLMLESDYDISEATNGAEALEILEKGEHIFRLILLDLVMPVMDGFTLLKILQERKLQQQLPTIIISGDNSEEALDTAYGLGAVDFFTKPFNPCIVKHRVQNVLSLYSHSYQDHLTGCYNRNGFIQVTENFIRQAEDPSQYSIFFYDIKNFKAINTLVGNSGGDTVLQFIHNSIHENPLDTLFVGRLEADHFVCLVKNENVDVDAMMETNGSFVDINGRALQIRFRVGIAKINSREPITVYMDRAKLALGFIDDEYLKSYAEFDEKMAQDYVNAAVVATDFETSLENDEFKVYYQPIMEAATGKVASAEALIRWIHPQRGFVRPDLFIPVLEKDGYISKLDLFVDLKVNSVIDEWKASGLPTVPVSVNLSWMDFFDNEMIQFILNRLELKNVTPGSVRYEITESSFAALKENRGDILKQMQQRGAWLLMDDFGSGYSSLAMLLNYKFDVLKIDMSIVRQLGSSPKVEHVVELIINMCHHLGMKVVAEGVETERQLEILKQYKCDYIQGYYFSKPLPEEEFKAFLAQKKSEGKIVEY